jgi:hypothetical protein
MEDLIGPEISDIGRGQTLRFVFINPKVAAAQKDGGAAQPWAKLSSDGSESLCCTHSICQVGEPLHLIRIDRHTARTRPERKCTAASWSLPAEKASFGRLVTGAMTSKTAA